MSSGGDSGDAPALRHAAKKSTKRTGIHFRGEKVVRRRGERNGCGKVSRGGPNRAPQNSKGRKKLGKTRSLDGRTTKEIDLDENKRNG